MPLQRIPMLLDALSISDAALIKQNKENIERIYSYLQELVDDINSEIDGINNQPDDEITDVFTQNIISIEKQYTAAQVDTEVIAAVSEQTIIITQIQVSVDNSTVPDVAFRVAFGTSTEEGVILSHPGMPPGSVISRGDGAGVVAKGTDRVNISSTVATAGSIRVLISYFRVETADA